MLIGSLAHYHHIGFVLEQYEYIFSLSLLLFLSPFSLPQKKYKIIYSIIITLILYIYTITTTHNDKSIILIQSINFQ